MRVSIRKTLIMILLIASLCLLVGCEAEPEPNTIVSEDVNINSETEPEKQTVTPEPEPVTNTVTLAPALVQGVDFQIANITFYTVDIATADVRALNAAVGSDEAVMPEKIVELVLEALDDESIELGVNSVTLENDTCYIDFDRSIYAVSILGADVENAVLDALAQSVLDNIEDCNSVVYRISSREYVTSNNSFKLDQVYMDD